MTTTFSFGTGGEAAAFIQGIEFVNDSALDVLDTYVKDGRHYVVVDDADGVPDGDEIPTLKETN